MTTIGATPTTSATADPAAATDREKLAGVAKQFEAIFLRQMLASARKTNFGGEDGIFSSEGMDTFRQMQDDRFADIASETGTFGLGKMIETHLARFAADGAGHAAADTAAGTEQEAPRNGI
ncbi:MAG: rod-binding protein [Sphingomonadales bacterium]|nr:rod-binding protein [Sphingomonadales bacterium]